MQDSAKGAARRAAAVPPVTRPTASAAAWVPGTNSMPATDPSSLWQQPGWERRPAGSRLLLPPLRGGKTSWYRQAPCGTRTCARHEVWASHAACWQCVKPSSATTKATAKATPHRLCYCARGSSRAAPFLLLSSRSMCAGSTAGGPNLKPTASAPKRPRTSGDPTKPPKCPASRLDECHMRPVYMSDSLSTGRRRCGSRGRFAVARPATGAQRQRSAPTDVPLDSSAGGAGPARNPPKQPPAHVPLGPMYVCARHRHIYPAPPGAPGVSSQHRCMMRRQRARVPKRMQAY